MISAKSFTKEWIQAQRLTNRGAGSSQMSGVVSNKYFREEGLYIFSCEQFEE